MLVQCFASIPKEKDLSIDKQICVTKAHYYIRQYMPNKPKNHGFHAHCFIGNNFEIHTGQEAQILDGEKYLGVSSKVVVRLARGIPRHINHKLFYDNYYTSIPLLVCLHSLGILAVGTVRSNHVINTPLSNEKTMILVVQWYVGHGCSCLCVYDGKTTKMAPC